MRNYKRFVEHIREWDNQGIPYGISDLLILAKKYNTPTPNSERWFAAGFKEL